MACILAIKIGATKIRADSIDVMFKTIGTLLSRIRGVSDYLEDLSANPDQVALLVIDVQHEFCDPADERGNKETEEVAGKIQTAVPEFRKAGIDVYAIYFDNTTSKDPKDVDFYKFRPEDGDTLVAKTTDSAFSSSNIDMLLKRRGYKHLLVCGFNMASCVRRTIIAAHNHGYRVTLLEDLTGNDNLNGPAMVATARRLFKKNGTNLSNMGDVLGAINCSSSEKARRAMPSSPS